MTHRLDAALPLALLLTLATLPGHAQAPDLEACLGDPGGDVDHFQYEVDQFIAGRHVPGVPDPNDVTFPPSGGIWPSDWSGGSLEVTFDDDGCPHLHVKPAGPALGPLQDHGGEPDTDGSGMGDAWEDFWRAAVGVLEAGGDLDQDGLLNVDEYRWQTNPACLPYNDIPLPPGVQEVHDCRDYEANQTTGAGGDSWRDGDEVRYWNNVANDLPLTIQTDGHKAGVAYLDPDRLLDSDGDTFNNTNDPDSDEDGWQDGDEVHQYGTYPEHKDSDCAPSATACTPVASTTYHGAKQGQPGAGDHMPDAAEYAAWNFMRAGSWDDDFDGDGIPPLLDPDSDNDGLLDSQEFLFGRGQVTPDVADSDGDGLLDGQEVAWDQDSDGDGFLNANDGDSDNDGMPDPWEVQYGFSMVVATDAALDRDEDRLTNLREYQLGTNPNSPDSEGDFVLDGDEVLVHQTNPLWWDTDHDGMPDAWELQHGLQPRDAADAALDPDGDSYGHPNGDRLEWTNLREYTSSSGEYGGWDEEARGPWLGGTDPRDADSDDDGAPDGMEAYVGSNPNLRGDNAGDADQDGLNWTEEVAAGTWVYSPDTDFDGLCDGGRAPACRRSLPGGGEATNQRGEADYGSLPRSMDSDRDMLSDTFEAQYWDPEATGSTPDLDGDFLGGIIDFDSDGDGLADGTEQYYSHTNVTLADTDNDRLLDGQEYKPYCPYHCWKNTDPFKPDTDEDGLLDGDEKKVHGTKPYYHDSDTDGVNDGSEVRRAMNPLSEDSDQDGMRDGYERDNGLEPTVDDTAADLDADELANLQEYRMGTNPRQADSDGDAMPDGWEHRFGLQPAKSGDAAGDADFDGLANAQEYAAGSLPTWWDTDNDYGSDAFEVLTLGTSPLDEDSDDDQYPDYWEYDAFVLLGYDWESNVDGDAYMNALTDADSDNDGLSDYEELSYTHTDPTRQDTDGDGDLDSKEVIVDEGYHDPNDADSDDDGTPDNFDPPQAEVTGDRDQDGLADGDEAEFGTDPDNNDSDCDGVKDGAELFYWGNAWNLGMNRLLTPDVDQDSILDGVEIGPVGMPPDSVYRTLPDDEDTDDDGLLDDEEARSNVRVTCGSVEGAASMQMADAPVLGPGLLSAWTLGPAVPASASAGGGVVWREASGTSYGVDGEGVFLRGAYGVRLYLADPLASRDPATAVSEFLSGARLAMAAGGPGTNGERTDPTRRDTDGDGLTDGHEVLSSGTDPVDCDSDHDRLGDGVELGVSTGTSDSGQAECQHRDRAAPGMVDVETDPLVADSDGDQVLDGVEDPNGNGHVDVAWTGKSYQQTTPVSDGPESNPLDADTDDDGVADATELLPNSLSQVLDWDSDHDGLSDGLETGVSSRVALNGVTYTRDDIYVFGLVEWKTWQPWLGTTQSGTKATTTVNDADSDDDGIIDGLEDLNRNGKYGSTDADELDARHADTDRDGLSDGLELRIWGPTNNPDHAPFHFMEAVEHWQAASVSALQQKLQWNPGNPMQTNPRDANTDDDGSSDGNDVNPLGDTRLSLTFGNFQMLEQPDAGCPGCESAWSPDVKISLVVTLPSNVGFTAQTIELDFPNSHDGFDLGDWLSGQSDFVRDPTSPSGLAALAWTGGTIVADLFDSIDKFPTTSPCKDAVCMSLRFRDMDQFGGHNDVDLHPLNGRTYYGQNGIQDWPIGFASTPCDSTENALEMRGAGDPDDQNGLLDLTSNVNIYQSFLNNARQHSVNPAGVVGPPANDVAQQFAEGCP